MSRASFYLDHLGRPRVAKTAPHDPTPGGLVRQAVAHLRGPDPPSPWCDDMTCGWRPKHCPQSTPDTAAELPVARYHRRHAVMKCSKPSQGQRQPRGGGAASGGQCAAPLRQRPGSLPAAEESAPGSAQGHHGHGPQAGQNHLLHAALRPAVRGCWRRILRASVSPKGVAHRPASGRSTGLPVGADIRCPGFGRASPTRAGDGVTVSVSP